VLEVHVTTNGINRWLNLSLEDDIFSFLSTLDMNSNQKHSADDLALILFQDNRYAAALYLKEGSTDQVN
jgi:hypothetical protein